MSQAAKSLIKMRCEVKSTVVNDVKDRLKDYESRKKALDLQMFALQNDLDSVQKKLLKAVKSNVRERLLLEKANLESVLECKQQLLQDVNVVIEDLNQRMPEMEKLLCENRWIKALNNLNAESVD